MMKYHNFFAGVKGEEVRREKGEGGKEGGLERTRGSGENCTCCTQLGLLLVSNGVYFPNTLTKYCHHHHLQTCQHSQL